MKNDIPHTATFENSSHLYPYTNDSPSLMQLKAPRTAELLQRSSSYPKHSSPCN
ncbi:hypothetical protein BDR05DRAFT_967294 [Suillus weaverae]|nr:hypothetical protein BDR05DRAFT_967294 [Suillus weaverae]